MAKGKVFQYVVVKKGVDTQMDSLVGEPVTVVNTSEENVKLEAFRTLDKGLSAEDIYIEVRPFKA